MKLLVPCFVVLALAACGSSNTSTTSSGTGATGGSTTGGKSGSSTGSSTGSAAGTTTGVPLGQDCTIDSQGNDSCTGFGLQCNATTLGGSGTCILPQNLSECDHTATYGCQDGGSVVWTDAGIPTDAGVVTDAGVDVDAGVDADGGTIVDVVWVDAGPFDVAATGYVDAGFTYDSLVCAQGFQNANGVVDVCLQPCSETFPDCPLAITFCLTASTPAGCFFNDCQTQNPFDTCDATSAGANDGQCLPYLDSTGTTINRLICNQNGGAQNGTPCDPNFRTGTDPQCGYYDFCQPNVGNDGGLCYPMTLDGGNCDATTDAIQAAASIFGAADFGICVQDCTTGQTCTAGTCQDLGIGGPQGCLP